MYFVFVYTVFIRLLSRFLYHDVAQASGPIFFVYKHLVAIYIHE
jgi:hypothetical protein